MCHSCGNFYDHGRWRDLDYIAQASRILGDATRVNKQIEDIQWEIPEFEPEKGEHRVMCQAIAMIGGQEFTQDFEIGIRIKVQMCPSCSRQNSDYFEAIIQLRRDGVAARNAEAELAVEDQQILEYVETLAGNEENAFLTKWGAVPGGMDYYIGSISLAKNIAARMRENYGARVKESNSLIGMKDGQDLYRWTILIRLPIHGQGDIVAYEKNLYVIESVTRKVLKLKSVSKGQIYRMSPEDAKIKTVAKYSELMEAVVVSIEDKAIQILDPESYKTVTVFRPPYMKQIGDTVQVVRYDELLHAV